MCVCVCGGYGDNMLGLHKLIQEPWERRRERGAAITCGSLLPESTSRLSVYFSLFPRGTELLEERASYALTTSHPNWSLYLNGPIFSVENCCNSEEKMTAFLFVLAAVFLTDITKVLQI